MRNYDRINTRKPEGIDSRNAHIVGGGIAGLATAAFLTTDGHMPGPNITVYEQLEVVGGSMDGAGSAIGGYVSRGERELEPYMECLWYLFSMVPSLDDPERTVLDETRECNRDLPIYARRRLFENHFQPRDISSLGLSKHDRERLLKLLASPEIDIEDITIESWFSPAFFETNLWYFWASMLAFHPYHSLIEMKRYALRFIQHLDGIEHLKGILRTKYDQYTSMILPLKTWLAGKGVRFITGATVTEIGLEIEGERKTATALKIEKDGSIIEVPVPPCDIVYFTNGSMTQNSTHGNNKTTPRINNDFVHRGAFSVWEKLAAASPVFGRPEKFVSAPDKSQFVSFTITVTDYPELLKHIEKRTDGQIGTAGAITLVDTPWFISFNVPPQPFFTDQPSNVEVFWGYGLCANAVGSHVGKPMNDCTGEEILKEFLHHLDFSDHYDAILPHTRIITSMMPYITSQFMPRGVSDRPQVIPQGCTNLAFIGQFVELEGDVVFTVETSVRTAMIAVYRTLKLDKPIVPLFEGQYDLRILAATIKKILDADTIGPMDFLPSNLLELPAMAKLVFAGLNAMPKMKSYYPELTENR